MLKNTAVKWGTLAQTLHWGIMVLFVGMWLVAEQMQEMPQDATFLGLGKWDLYGMHKATGMLILALVLVRVAWRFMNPTPSLGEQSTPLQKMAANLVHLGLYGVMLGMPISGYLMSMAGGHSISFYGLFNVPDIIGKNPDLGKFAHFMHGAIWNVFTALIVLHILAAVYHHFMKKDMVLRRMLPGKVA